MRLITNSVAPTQVKETDSEYIIENVPFIKPMELSGGYVPRANIKETTPRWDGVPATLNHPRNDRGQPVAADRKPETHIGHVENPRFDGEFVRANIRIQKANLQSAAAADIKAALENGEKINVSSQYAAQPAPSGEYDGQIRENVEKITRPDSVAILPNQQGKCSVKDGCGINPEMVANAEVQIPMQGNADAQFSDGDMVRWSTQGSPGTGRVAQVVTEPGEQVVSEADVENPPVREATEDEPVYKLDDWDGEEFVSGQVVKSESEILGEWSDPPDEALEANAVDIDGVPIPEEFTFDNPGEAMEKAQEMGFEEIHTHGEGDDTTFMPGPSHDDLVSALTDDGEMPEVQDNNTQSANQTDLALTDVSPGDVDYTDREWNGPDAEAGMPNPSESDDNAAILDQAFLLHPTDEDARDSKANWKLPFRQGPDAPVNTRALVAAKGGRGLPAVDDVSEATKDDTMERIQDFLVDAPSDLFGSIESEQEGAAKHGDEMSDNMGDKTEELISNHGFRPDHLPPEDSRCFQRIYQQFTANTMSNDTQTDDKIGLDDLSEDAQNALVERAEERIEANRKEQQKTDLAGDIVANSNEYDETESVLEDYPTMQALKTKKKELTTTGATPSMGVTREDMSSNDEIDFDVGTGVLTE